MVEAMGALIRICAVAAAVLVAASFGLFAIDKAGEGKDKQVEAVNEVSKPTSAPSQLEIDQPAPTPSVERVREARHSNLREYIDDADDVLLTPFAGLVDTDNVWAQRAVPGFLAILLYGGGGMLLANAIPQRRRKAVDWRESTS